MKLVIFVFAIASLFLVGCFSTTYVASEFKSKEDFEKHFNKHAGGKDLKVELKNDTSYGKNFSSDGGAIKNDSLSVVRKEHKVEYAEIPLSQIKSIAYKDANNTSADLSLANGKEIFAENLLFQPNKLKCTVNENLLIKNNLSLNSIKEVSYNNSRGRSISRNFMWFSWRCIC